MSPENRSNEEIRADLAVAHGPQQDDDAAYMTWHEAVLNLLGDIPALLADRARIGAALALCDADEEASLRPAHPDFEPIEIPWTVAVRAALAASPTPTGPETKRRVVHSIWGQDPSGYCGCLDCNAPDDGPATPTEPTKETP